MRPAINNTMEDSLCYSQTAGEAGGQASGRDVGMNRSESSPIQLYVASPYLTTAFRKSTLRPSVVDYHFTITFRSWAGPLSGVIRTQWSPLANPAPISSWKSLSSSFNVTVSGTFSSLPGDGSSFNLNSPLSRGPIRVGLL